MKTALSSVWAFALVRVFAVISLFAASAFSQTAQLTGSVIDISASVVPGARVVATNLDTGVTRESVTNETRDGVVETVGKREWGAAAAVGFAASTANMGEKFLR